MGIYYLYKIDIVLESTTMSKIISSKHSELLKNILYPALVIPPATIANMFISALPLRVLQSLRSVCSITAV